MKKSIFLFFAAILCAMTANAACYLKGSFNDWSEANPMAVSGTTATCTIDLAGSTTFEFKVNNGSSWHGSSSTVTSTATTITLNGGDNAKITTTIPGAYTFSFNTSSKTLTVTYPTAPAPHDITVRAQVPASWTNTITAWVWTSENGSGEEVTPTKDGDYYVVTKNAGALYAIFKNGAGWNGDQNQTVDLCYTEDVCLQINQSGSAKATATVIDCGAVAKDITVKAVVPGAWENTITAWVWPTGGEGKEVTPTKDGNWYVVTENCIELNVIFKNGTGWNGDANQTVNIEGVSENTCYQISALNKEGGKCSVAIVDCEAVIEPEAKPEPTPTYDYYVTGTFNGWNEKDPAHGMTLDGEVYKATVTLATGENLVKVTDGTWAGAKGYSAMGAEYEEVSQGASDDNILVDLTEGKEVVVVYNATTNKVTFEGLTEKAPAPTFDYYITGSFNGDNPKKAENGMTLDETVYKATVTLAVGDNTLKVTDGTWDNTWGYSELGAAYEEVSDAGEYNNIKITLAAEKTITVIFDATGEGKITFEGLTEEAPVVLGHDYYITGSFNGDNPADEEHGMTLDGTVYKATVTLAEGDNTLKVTDGTWDNTWGATELGAAYEEVSNPNDYNNIKITLAAEKEITVIFDATAGKITFEGLTEAAPAEPVTVYFINSGEWAEVACYYWGGLNGSEWPGVQMDLTAETYEAEGWNVYKVTFPGDNTSCIFNDNKAEGAKQTGNLEVHDGQYYCYENGIWYERLADVDPLDTRVYLKGDMNEWCNNGWCDMFRKENVSETVAYITTWLEANTTYEFKIESAGAWLSNTGTMEKDNCTGWTFEESVNDNAKITTEYAGDYTFIWDMTTNKLSVEYPDPKANPTVLDLMVTNMVFDGETTTFSGSDNTYGIALNLVVGDMIDEGVYALNASSTVDFGGTLFTDVTGTITPDMSLNIATAVVYGFFDGTYFQLNVDMSAGGGTLVEIWDGVATPNDGTGELTISANWDGDDVYVVVAGFDYTNYECPEAWFYIGGITWETADIAAFGPATITVEDGGVLVEGSVISGATGAQYELMVFGLLPVEETPDYTRTVTADNFGTICLPYASSSYTGMELYEVSWLQKDGETPVTLYLDQLEADAQLEAGKPYIFRATSTELTVTYTGDAADAPVEGANGLTGSFNAIPAGGVLTGNYVIAQNQFWTATAEASAPENRAYINATLVPTTEPAKVPGRRRVSLGAAGENAETGIDNIISTDTPVKVIENGQLIIIRGGEKFNAQGVRL